MARRRKSYSRTRSYDPGRERARQHSADAHRLSAELGGTDKDVKQYFFSLPPEKLGALLSAYGNRYGADARSYAEATLPKWRAGRVTMSGTVAERLFSLLPPMMPIEQKFALSSSLWDFVAPENHHSFMVGPDADVNALSNEIKSHLMSFAATHDFPEAMRKRFAWLSQGDIEVQKELMAYLRDRERKLVLDLCVEQLPLFMKEIGRADGLQRSIKHTLKFKKYQCHVYFQPHLQGITQKSGIYVPPRPPADFSWAPFIWIAIGLFLLYIVFGHSGR